MEHLEEKIEQHLVENGRTCMSYSTKQKGLEYYIQDDVGYIAYYRFRHWLLAPTGINVVLGDPVAPLEKFDSILKGYQQNVSGPSVYLHAGYDFAKAISRTGILVNEMGLEFLIELSDFDLSLKGKKYTHIRRWRNKAEKAGVEVREQTQGSVDLERLKEINDAWIKKKGGLESTLLTRPIVFEDEPDVRRFYAYLDGKLIGIQIYEPIYSKGNIIGYYQNACRLDKSAPNGTNDLVLLNAMNKFSIEGRSCVSLGIAPLADIEDKEMESRALVRSVFGLLFKHGKVLYNFQGSYFHKEKYRSKALKLYVAGYPKLTLKNILATFKAMKFF